MTICESILTKNPCYSKGYKRKLTKGLMLHSVGTPQPNAKVFINKWNKATYDSACVHAFIDANDGTVYQTLPWNWRGWHCGRSGNDTHIGVEMCEPDCIKYIGGATFTCSDLDRARAMATTTYNSAVRLFALLCQDFNLDPLTGICSHKEGAKLGIASNHGDPEHLWIQLKLPYTMDGFRADVKRVMMGEDEMTEKEIRAIVVDEMTKYFANLAQMAAPAWAETDAAYQKALSEGIFDGKRPLAYATRLEAAIMAARESK